MMDNPTLAAARVTLTGAGIVATFNFSTETFTVAGSTTPFTVASVVNLAKKTLKGT
jgi:small neutral amino acid transporter SnatA (MarC family)